MHIHIVCILDFSYKFSILIAHHHHGYPVNEDINEVTDEFSGRKLCKF